MYTERGFEPFENRNNFCLPACGESWTYTWVAPSVLPFFELLLGRQMRLSWSKRSPAENGLPGSKTARRTCCNRFPVTVTYPPMMPALKTEISNFDGTVTKLQRNLGLHDNIQAYLQLENDGNWYASWSPLCVQWWWWVGVRVEAFCIVTLSFSTHTHTHTLIYTHWHSPAFYHKTYINSEPSPPPSPSPHTTTCGSPSLRRPR